MNEVVQWKNYQPEIRVMIEVALDVPLIQARNQAEANRIAKMLYEGKKVEMDLHTLEIDGSIKPIIKAIEVDLVEESI